MSRRFTLLYQQQRESPMSLEGVVFESGHVVLEFDPTTPSLTGCREFPHVVIMERYLQASLTDFGEITVSWHDGKKEETTGNATRT